MQNNDAFKSLIGIARLEILTSNTADTLTGLAKNGDLDAIAYRYALKELNPFAVIGADYAPHNNGNSLDLYTPTGGGQVTESWIADGAAENLPVNPKKAPKIPLPASHAANESRLQQAA